MKSATVEVRNKLRPSAFIFDNEIISGEQYKSLSIYAVITYLVLRRHADNGTSQCYLLLSTLAEEARSSRSSVKRAIDELKESGLVEVEYREAQSSVFTLLPVNKEVSSVGTYPPQGVSPVGTGVSSVGTTEGYFLKGADKLFSPKNGEARTDGRYPLFIEDLNKYWDHSNTIPFSFGAPDGRAVKAFLKSNPKLTRPEFQNILQNRRHSDRVPHSEPIHRWLGSCLKYASGALDAYGKPKASGRDGMEAFEDADTVIARMNGKTTNA